MSISTKKALFIIPYIPYPLDSGGNQAFFNMVDYLRQFMNVSLLLDISKSEENAKRAEALQGRWPDVTFYLFNKKTASVKEELYVIHQKRYYNILAAIRASVTRKMRRRCKKKVVDLVREKSTIFSSTFKNLDPDYVQYVYDVSRKGFDMIQVEFYELLSLVYILPSDVATIFVHHELRFIRNEQEIKLLSKVIPTDLLQLKVARDYEKSALNHYKNIIALTETDRRLLMEFTNRKTGIYASPAIVSCNSIKNSNFVSATNTLSFVGSGGHFPNLDGLTWFCSDIAPLLRAAGFKFKLFVTGTWNEKDIFQKLQDQCPEIESTGFVEDLTSVIKGSINIVPIRIGSGMRMKIIDSIVARVPFITTSKGVEGLDFQNEKECLIADDASAFAKAIITLSQDARLQEQMAEAAYNRLRLLYNPQQMLERRLNIYKQILEDPK